MPTNDQLWGLVHTAFEAHRKRSGDVDAHTAFERVAQKSLGLSERRYFNAENSDIKLESLNRGDLGSVTVYHNRTNPKGNPELHHGPLVMIDFGGTRYAIDGNNRINLWRESDSEGPYEAVIVTPREK